jgi:hypothetical protein
MSDWRESLLKPFVPGIARKTVVADPDDLFRDDRIFREITDRGFTLVFFEDSISFRFIYESEIREAWDRGESRELVVVVRPETGEFDKVPADLVQNARRLTFYLKDIFPNLSYGAVLNLDRAYYDILFNAHNLYAKEPMGEALTKEFILKHVFETVPELIKKESELLRALLQRHYRKQQVPARLDEYFLSVLQKAGRFQKWPLKAILPDRAAFWEFLQERWGLFVRSHVIEGGEAIAEAGALKYPGVRDLPFNHDDVRVYIDNLFTEGILKPVEWVAAAVKVMPWIRVGLRGGALAQEEIRFEDLCKGMEQNIPAQDANAYAWQSFAYQYGQMQRVWNENAQALKPAHGERYTNLRRLLNERFSSWMSAGYRGIYNYPAVNPVMVHHIPGFLANRLVQKDALRVALLLIDGLSVDQWLLLKDHLASGDSEMTFRESALMAWVPTITPVSRQAAYSGKIPAYFSETVFRSDNDEYGWRQFWSDRGFQLAEVAFCTVPGNFADMAKLDAVLTHETRVLGCTIFKVDKIMHGMQLGAPGMTGQVKAWAEEGFLSALIQKLISENFHVFISADHGNVASVGIGIPKEGALCDTKGVRCRIYSDQRLREVVQADFPESISWDHQGLPNGFHCLLAPPEKAFTHQGQTVVCHGGVSLDEVMVPFIEIFRRRADY